MKVKFRIFGIITVIMLIMCLMVGCDDLTGNDDDDTPGGGGGGGSSSLSAPTGVTAIGSSSSSITITWNAVTSAESYIIYRSDSLSGTYAEIDSTSGLSYTSSNLAANTTFYYKVAACTHRWGSSWGTPGNQSSAVSATTFLVAPTGVSATSETSSSITINWNNLTGATGYRIYRSGSSSGTYSEIGTSTSNSYTDTGLPSYVSYYYRVSGYNNLTEGDNSSYVSATTLLKAPTGVTATADSSSSITISWNAATDAESYLIYRSDSLFGTYVEITYTTSLTYTNTGLSPNTTFYYKVAACTHRWGSSWGTPGEQSSVVSATTF